jgi:hypothetical protein
MPEKVEFYNRINLNNQCVWLVIKKKVITINGLMNVKVKNKVFEKVMQNVYWESLRKSSFVRSLHMRQGKNKAYLKRIIVTVCIWLIWIRL